MTETTERVTRTGTAIRRRLLTSTTGLLGGILLACGETAPTNTPPPVGLGSLKASATPDNEPYFDRRFDTVIAKGKELEEKFPKEFAGGSKIAQRLKELVNTQEISVDDENPLSMGIVRNPLPYSEGGVIKVFNNRLAVGSQLLSLQPEVQVMTLLHELGHYDDRRKILQPFIGKADTPAIHDSYTKALNDFMLEAESKELFRNCQQLAALKSVNPNFTANQPAPFEAKLPTNGNRSLYDTYTSIKTSPSGYKDGIWIRAVNGYLAVAANQ